MKLFSSRTARRIGYMFLIALSAGYALFMMKVLFFRGPIGYRGLHYNLIPLKTILQYIIRSSHYNFRTVMINLIGNIVVFIPLGFIFPFFKKSLRAWARFGMVLILTLLGIETLQLMTREGTFDVDDIILNTVGGFIGFIGYGLLAQWRRFGREQGVARKTIEETRRT